MNKLYKKSELWFALAWIAVFIIGNSIANPVSEWIGIEKSAHAVFTIALSVILFVWIKRNGLTRKYGLCAPNAPAKQFLFYIPLVMMASLNFWNGANINFDLAGTISYIAYMLAIGFLEEAIFRGLLFKALEKDNLKTAIVISSVTFGLGHFIHLINGSGAELFENIMQVIGAIAVGFLFVTIYYKSKSLLPCIFTHAAIDVASAFANEVGLTPEKRVLFSAIYIAVIAIYTFILWKTLPKRQETQEVSA